MDQRQHHFHQQQQQQQQKSISSSIVANHTEPNRASSYERLNSIKNSGYSPPIQLPTNSNNHLSIISLSKLKNYMPQNQALAAEFFKCPNPPLKQSQSVAEASASMANLASYKGSCLDESNQSSSINKPLDHHNSHEKLARAKSPSLSSSLLNNSSRAITEQNSVPTEGSSDYQQTYTNQVVAELQQERKQRQQPQQRSRSTPTSDSCRLIGSHSTNKSSKGVESEGVEKAVSEVRDYQLAVASGEERKRKKIDTKGRSKDANATAVINISCNKGVGAQGGRYIRNNMTPSSLLLLQNHNYIEQQQQQQHQANPNAQYNDNNRGQLDRGDDNRASIGQSRAGIADDCSVRDALGTSGEQSEDQHHQPQVQCNDPSLSSSSLMLTNVNQFKPSEIIGDSSIINSANNLTSSSANIVDSSNYSTLGQGLNQVHNRLRGANVLAPSDSINNLQQNYQQQHGLTTYDFKAAANGAIGEGQFNHYSGPNNRLSDANHYHQSFHAAQMLGHHIKLENAMSNRNITEENNSIVTSDHNVSGNAGIESYNVPRNLALQPARIRIYQNNYNNDYNLMPTNSSKSSSPTSSTSTPSPKTNTMNQTTSQHPNQFVLATGTNSSSQTHLDHSSHHYMGNNIAANDLGQQQHHASQHYPNYNQPSSGRISQHNLIMSAHDQSYVHQQQHQLQQPQQQQQQHQQSHQHHQTPPQPPQQIQQNIQQHNQHQQSIATQQSIYHQLANNAANVNVNHIYYNTGTSTHYQGHIQTNSGAHQPNHLISGAHQSHLNSTAAACAAAAVVSQTLKTVANQQNQQHHYGGSNSNRFVTNTGSLMDMTAQHHQQFQHVNQLSTNHLANQSHIAQPQQQQSLPVHHTTSMVTRKYQCKMCPQVFMSKAELKYHNQNHMREAKPYKCLQCPKAFANSSYLSQHMRIHQGVKPYTCDICSRKFTQLSHLQQHKRTHTGDKPYKCNYMNCTKQFSQLSNLQSHSRCHQLDKPYKCNSCYKCFHDEQSLLEHIPRHLESKHLKKNLCIFCGSSYQQERGLVKHFQQYHTDKSPTLVAAAIAAGTTGNTNLIASLVSSTPTNAFVTPSSGGGSSSSSSSSISSSGSLNVHNNNNVNLNIAHSSSVCK